MRLSEKDFREIYEKVPRLCVDIVIKNEDGVLLSMRSIKPYNGMWHIPGGTVYKEEKLEEAAIRIAKKETGLDVDLGKYLGYIEYLNEKRFGGYGHSFSVMLEAVSIGGELKSDENSKELKYFKELPENLIKEQRDFLTNLLDGF